MPAQIMSHSRPAIPGRQTVLLAVAATKSPTLLGRVGIHDHDVPLKGKR